VLGLSTRGVELVRRALLAPPVASIESARDVIAITARARHLD
jgi:hypothetical protein